MSEDELEARVRVLFETLGLLAYHSADSRRATRRGFPDWVIAGPRGVLWRELKSTEGRTSLDQLHWLRSLRAAGQNAEVWRPADWYSGRIARELLALV